LALQVARAQQPEIKRIDLRRHTSRQWGWRQHRAPPAWWRQRTARVCRLGAGARRGRGRPRGLRRRRAFLRPPL